MPPVYTGVKRLQHCPLVVMGFKHNTERPTHLYSSYSSHSDPLMCMLHYIKAASVDMVSLVVGCCGRCVFKLSAGLLAVTLRERPLGCWVSSLCPLADVCCKPAEV